ncbi:recombinase family protein [Streptomyces sp. MAR4 CNY-716]
MAKPQRVGIYVRISKDAKGQELGIKRQEKACRELCKQRGWRVLKTYPENDISASTTSRRKRPQYAQMMKDARAGVIDAVVVYSIDRLTRRLSELTAFLDEQKAHRFQFATTEGEDTSTANGRMILSIKGAVAQGETERMAERVNDALRQRREQGKPHAGGPRVFGFEEGSNFQRLVPEEVELIREGYRMLMERQTTGDVARLWNERGARTAGTGTAWTIQKVKRVYRSERVGGIVTYQGQEVGDSTYPHPLTRREWENVQTVLDERSTPAHRGAGRRKHLYRGFLRCGHCGSLMSVQWMTLNGKRRRRAFCNSSQIVKETGEPGCGKVYRAYDWIEARLDEVVEAALLKRRPKPRPRPVDDDLSSEIERQERRVRDLRQRWKDGQMEDEDYYDSLGHLRETLRQLRAREAAATVAESREEVDALTVWRDDRPENLERRRTIAAGVIERVEVYSVGRGRRKPPELDSIEITPRGAESG